jgi:3,4-dihydroxy 2-butanone 4-phosphate synthase/GTP cyclohydrolase II
MTQERARQLRLPLMVEENQDSKKTAFTVTVDYKVGLTTGVSAIERAHTARALADNSAAHSDFIRPGHVFPLIADKGGLAARKGHTEAGVALAQLVGAAPLTLLSEIVAEDGSMARGQSLKDFAAEYLIPMVSIQELIGIAPAVEEVRSDYEFLWADLPLRWNVEDCNVSWFATKRACSSLLWYSNHHTFSSYSL